MSLIITIGLIFTALISLPAVSAIGILSGTTVHPGGITLAPGRHLLFGENGLKFVFQLLTKLSVSLVQLPLRNYYFLAHIVAVRLQYGKETVRFFFGEVQVTDKPQPETADRCAFTVIWCPGSPQAAAFRPIRVHIHLRRILSALLLAAIPSFGRRILGFSIRSDAGWPIRGRLLYGASFFGGLSGFRMFDNLPVSLTCSRAFPACHTSTFTATVSITGTPAFPGRCQCFGRSFCCWRSRSCKIIAGDIIRNCVQLTGGAALHRSVHQVTRTQSKHKSEDECQRDSSFWIFAHGISVSFHRLRRHASELRGPFRSPLHVREKISVLQIFVEPVIKFRHLLLFRAKVPCHLVAGTCGYILRRAHLQSCQQHDED